VKLSRHVSCESCESFTNGGYDSINKQVIAGDMYTEQVLFCVHRVGDGSIKQLLFFIIVK